MSVVVFVVAVVVVMVCGCLCARFSLAVHLFAAAAVRHQPRDLPRRAQDVDAGLRHPVSRLPTVRDQRHAEQQRLHRPDEQHVSAQSDAWEKSVCPPLTQVVLSS